MQIAWTWQWAKSVIETAKHTTSSGAVPEGDAEILAKAEQEQAGQAKAHAANMTQPPVLG